MARWETAGDVLETIGIVIAWLLFTVLVIGGLVLDFFVFMRYGFWGLAGLLALETVVFPVCFFLVAMIGMGIAHGICVLARVFGLDWHID